MKIAIELDDFSPRCSNFGLLEQMREHFPGFKITLFTVAWEIRWGEQTPITLEKFRPFSKATASSSDWLEVAVHGLTHASMEFAEKSYDEARKRVIIAEKMFANQRIPFAKIFKAPFWEISHEAERALTDLGYKVVKDGYFDWNMADEFPKFKGDKIHVAHGHVQETCGNGLEQVYPRLMKLPPKTTFHFLSEVLKAEKVEPWQLLGTDTANPTPSVPGMRKRGEVN